MVKKGQTKRVWTPKRKAEIAPEIYTAKRLRADFAEANPLSAFSADLFARTVKSSRFDENGMIDITLTND